MKRDLDGLSWMDGPTREQALAKLSKIREQDRLPGQVAELRRPSPSTRRDALFANVAAEQGLRDAPPARQGRQPDRSGRVGVHAAHRQRLLRRDLQRDVLPCGRHPRAALLRREAGARDELRGHRDGRRPRAHARLRRPRPAVRRGGQPPRLVGARRRRGVRPPRAGCGSRSSSTTTSAVDDDAREGASCTLGENIGDLGGLRLAFAAFRRAEAARPATPPGLAGFTPEQQFFVSYAQAWCSNYRPEALRLLVQTNSHSPPQFRVNGPLSNLSGVLRRLPVQGRRARWCAPRTGAASSGER